MGSDTFDERKLIRPKFQCNARHMQSIWPSTVNVLRGWPKFTGNVRARTQRLSTATVLRQEVVRALRKERFTSIASNIVSTAVRSTSVLPSSLTIEEIQSPSNFQNYSSNDSVTQTTAKLSRAAAHAVRMSVQQPGSPEAYLIIKSLQESVKQYKRGTAPNLYALQKVAIDFGQAVSPRLSMHCLIHGLIRRGLAVKAGKFAHDMIRAGVQVNGRTMETLTAALCQTDMAVIKDEGLRAQMQAARERTPFRLGVTPGKPIRINSGSVQSKSTRLAMQLFFAAKQYHKHRARQMFQQLIDACLLQGEIIVVSFLFAFLVKQWQLRRVQASNPSDDRNEKPPDVDTWPLIKNNLDANGGEVLLPEASTLKQTLDTIEAVTFGGALPDPHALRPSFDEVAQSLALIAGLLHERLLPYPQLSKLISLLTAFPGEPLVKVWTRRKSKWIYRNAREYFDEVLEDLLKRLPLAKHVNHGWTRLPILDRYSYNSLLHYALRYKASPRLGGGILNYMVLLGGGNAPDITTYNILLRSGTLLERDDLTLQTLRLLDQNPLYKDVVAKPVDASHKAAKLLNIKSIKDENFDAINPSSLSPIILLQTNNSTLTTYIMHLTSTGRPSAVIPLLFRILPELHIIDHPATTEEGRQQQRDMIKPNRRKSLERAVELGPQFFNAVLNALCKAGKTGLAERVWILAKQAEALSWDPSLSSNTMKPWCLPISAYTIMMQCYSAEGRKGFRLGHLSSLDAEWKPKSKGGVVGWAWFVLTVKEMASEKQAVHNPNPDALRSVERRLAARELGIQLMRSMRRGGRDVFDQLMAVTRNHAVRINSKVVRPPVPDARFFNAALELFESVPHDQARDTSLSPAKWRRLHRRSQERFMKLGGVGGDSLGDPRMEEVVFAMHDAGVQVPLRFRRYLIGKRMSPPSGTPNSMPPGPQLFKRVTKYRISVHRVQTNKTRGLPVRRFKGRRPAKNTLISNV